MLLFMGAMVGLVWPEDLAPFVFWDLTAIASYFLIGFDRDERGSRVAALMALLVTGVSAVLHADRAFVLSRPNTAPSPLPEIAERVEPDDHLTVAGALIAVGALAKSAQVPLHFWLPRAMAAPTPVSAYLHSAAMVAAGVFLLGRIYPLIAERLAARRPARRSASLRWRSAALLALSRDELKQLLAYSTISQYGYVVVMFGHRRRCGAAGATFYVLAHASGQVRPVPDRRRGDRGDRAKRFAARRSWPDDAGAGRRQRPGGGRRSPRCR